MASANTATSQPVRPAVLQPPTAAKPQKKTYYSHSQNLVIHANPGELVHDNGKLTRINQKHIRFGPLGGTAVVNGNPVNGGFGVFSTSDPELIAFLDDRIKSLGDIMDEQRFNQVSKSPAMIQQELERKIEEQNRLIAELKSSKD